jgi:putative GTP pyrophosphokinase
VISKSQVDRLGQRLKEQATASEDDLKLLDEYRRGFNECYEWVFATVRKTTGLEPSGRSGKLTRAIVEKLNRERSIRLSQIQDIAGCRVIVPTVIEQDDVVQRLLEVFDTAAIDDRRTVPSHGYRAVHVVVDCFGMAVEVQVRTKLQHEWAELSERLAVAIDPSLKYGGGPEEYRSALARLAFQIASVESAQSAVNSCSDVSERSVIQDRLPGLLSDVVITLSEWAVRLRQL